MSWLLVLVSNALKRSYAHSNAVVHSHEKSSALELIQPDVIQTQLMMNILMTAFLSQLIVMKRKYLVTII
ncbi:hypothetical protein [Aliivibrio fischeri]|uniref:hypothetical protein n=1 Tax=Aliivibrio fischeri TaxID=668 RepID=UPI001F214C59|nr:hypothetical protein [Aliivibrio fischeri]